MQDIKPRELQLFADTVARNAVYLLAIIPALLWAAPKLWFGLFFNQPLLNLSRFFGLISLGALVVTLLLALKTPILLPLRLRLFGSIDKLYRTHQIIGVTALVAAFLHWIFLILTYSNDAFGINFVTFPTQVPAYNFGILSFLIMLFAVNLTYIFIKINYRVWLFLHSLFSMFALLAFWHVVNISSDYQYFPALKYVLYAYLVAGTLAWLLRVIGKYFITSGAKFQIVDISTKHTGQETVLKLILTPVSPSIKADLYKPGHFVFVKLLSKNPITLEHPFTIVDSDAHKNTITLLIKVKGKGTKAFSKLTQGQVVRIKGPFGLLPEILESGLPQNVLFITAGVGVNTLLGTLKYLQQAQLPINLHAIYTLKDEQHSLLPAQTNLKSLKLWATNKQKRRLNIKDVSNFIEKNKLSPHNTLVVVTGPQRFIDKFSNYFQDKGFKVYTEQVRFNKPIWYLQILSVVIALITVLIFYTSK